MKKNILVTGAGALLGQGILRSLKAMNDREIVIHSADPDPRSTGHWLAHKAHTVPYAGAPEYLQAVHEIVRRETIDVVMIGTDTELPLYAEHKAWFESIGTKVIVSDSRVIEIASDKWKTAQFLAGNGFAYPESVMAVDRAGVVVFRSRNQFPYFAKPVDGARSKGIVVIHSDEDLEKLLLKPGNLVIQEFLPEDDGEFTSGCLVVEGKCRAVVTLRRDLRDGNTYRAYYKPEYAIYNKFIQEVAEKLRVDGPCNFQFRIREGKPVIFEINGRFSGTTPIRLMFGFNEVEALLRHILEGRQIAQPALRPGIVMRAWSDIFVTDTEIERFDQSKSLDNPQAIFYGFGK